MSKQMSIRVKNGRWSKTVTFPIPEGFEDWMKELSSKRRKQTEQNMPCEDTFIVKGDKRIEIGLSIFDFGETL